MRVTTVTSTVHTSIIGIGPSLVLCGPNAMFFLCPGIKDYCDRYGANITRVCETQSSARELAGATCSTIHEAMCRQTPVESLPERRQWRDSRLAALAAHKQQQDTKDKSQQS